MDAEGEQAVMETYMFTAQDPADFQVTLKLGSARKTSGRYTDYDDNTTQYYTGDTPYKIARRPIDETATTVSDGTRFSNSSTPFCLSKWRKIWI